MSVQSSNTTIDRRAFLVRATLAGAAVVAVQLAPSRALAARGDAARLIKELTGGTPPKSGRIRLDLPEVAEYGDTVPLTIEIESPMTEADYVDAVHIFAEENPLPHVVTFNFTPSSGRARVSTRIRLAKSQEVVALARMSNGDFYKAERQVRVTIGGCG